MTVYDKSVYLFNGIEFRHKRRLVLAVLHDLVRKNPTWTALQLDVKFPKEIHGYLPMIVNAETKCQWKGSRFFDKRAETLECDGEIYYICNQWGKENIDNFIERANEFGASIQKLS